MTLQKGLEVSLEDVEQGTRRGRHMLLQEALIGQFLGQLALVLDRVLVHAAALFRVPDTQIHTILVLFILGQLKLTTLYQPF